MMRHECCASGDSASVKILNQQGLGDSSNRPHFDIVAPAERECRVATPYPHIGVGQDVLSTPRLPFAPAFLLLLSCFPAFRSILLPVMCHTENVVDVVTVSGLPRCLVWCSVRFKGDARPAFGKVLVPQRRCWCRDAC